MTVKTTAQYGSHAQIDINTALWTYYLDWRFTYTFNNFFHPYVGELIQKLNRESLPDMLDPKFLQDLTAQFFATFYTELNSDLVQINHFPKEIDVQVGGPYANYNWELLFHVPLTIAVHLSKNQRFAEAQRWFHYIFDPTSGDMSVPTPLRVWRFFPFRQSDTTSIDKQLALLSKPDPTPDEVTARDHILHGYEAIRKHPFQPHAVARSRPVAYQYAVVMKYLDNLIAWGDSLFRQDTVESINEATQVYVLAANLLGARPQRIPPSGATRPRTFAELKQQGLDPLGNALVDLEGKFPFNLGTPQGQGGNQDGAGPLFGIGRALYFCIPNNDKLLGYWDTVADRLFKIRHCMNIEGVVRQLALFDPPIDPGMLVKAAAAGIDIGSVVRGLNQPAGPVRALLLVQKAMELCGEVRGLGGALLSAIEKGDGESLALMRQGHEIKVQQLTQDVRFLQWKQAEASTESLVRSRATALERYRYYLRLLGQTPDTNAAPDTLPLDRRQLTEENWDEAFAALVGQYEKAVPLQKFASLRLTGASSPTGQAGASGQGNLYLTTNEAADLNDHMPSARGYRTAATVSGGVFQTLALLPDFGVNLHFWGVGGNSKIIGGSTFAAVAHIVESSLNTKAAYEDSMGQSASKTGSFERRAEDWMLQANLAGHELIQIGRQILGSLIAEQIAHREYLNTQQQIAHSQEVDQFLREKFTNAELYAWMQGEVSRLYYEYYRFAFDTARKAEQTMKRELMRPEVDATDYVKFNYWDGGRKGLLSGEALYLDVKRMELAYHEHNKREYELTKHVSLRQLSPLALLTLKATGACEVTLPEWLFDLDGPGHYLRRIKSVSLSIPSVTGPYTSVNCTLTLSKSSLRKTPLLADGEYARQGSEDSRFTDYFGTIESIVTSNANNDSGLFETNLRDERLLPFEGAGAESTWKLELPAALRQFDYNTIADVILHVRYTARQGGAQLRDKAVEQLAARVAEANASGLALLLSLTRDFPSEWSRFATGQAQFTATVQQRYFPYFTQGSKITIDAIGLHTIHLDQVQSTTPQGVDLAALTTKLQGEGAFDLALVPDGVVLAPTQGEVFVVIKYSVETA